MKSDFTKNKDKFNHHTASQVCTFHSKSHMEKSKTKAALELAMFGKMHVMLKNHNRCHFGPGFMRRTTEPGRPKLLTWGLG